MEALDGSLDGDLSILILMVIFYNSLYLDILIQEFFRGGATNLYL